MRNEGERWRHSQKDGVLFFLVCLRVAEPMAEIEAHDFEGAGEGICDVDMFAGVLKLDVLWQLGHLWTISGHRSYCNHDIVRPWMQLATGPVAVYLMQEFDTVEAMRALRETFVSELRKVGPLLKIYTSEGEKPARPQAVISGTAVVTALDLGVALIAVGFTKVAANGTRGICWRFGAAASLTPTASLTMQTVSTSVMVLDLCCRCTLWATAPSHAAGSCSTPWPTLSSSPRPPLHGDGMLAALRATLTLA